MTRALMLALTTLLATAAWADGTCVPTRDTAATAKHIEAEVARYLSLGGKKALLSLALRESALTGCRAACMHEVLHGMNDGLAAGHAPQVVHDEVMAALRARDRATRDIPDAVCGQRLRDRVAAGLRARHAGKKDT